MEAFGVLETPHLPLSYERCTLSLIQQRWWNLVSFPRRQYYSSSVLDAWFYSCNKFIWKTTTSDFPSQRYRSKLRQRVANQNSWIPSYDVRYIRFIKKLFLLHIFTCIRANMASFLRCSCGTQELPVSDRYQQEYVAGCSTLRAKRKRKCSPRVARSNSFRRRSVVEQVQPFLYRKAKHYRLDVLEERECLDILSTYRELEEKKLQRESRLSRKIGWKEWSCLCQLGVVELQRWNKLARAAKHKLISSHLQLIHAICRDFLYKGLHFDDLVQEGVVGLLKAVERFDRSKGVRFSTYASWWIRHSLQRALNQYQHLIRLPVHISDALKVIRRERWLLSQQLGTLPQLGRLSQQTGISQSKVVHYCRLALLQLPSYSIEQVKSVRVGKKPVGGRHSRAMYDMFLREDLERCFSVLESTEREVLCLRFGWQDGKAKTLSEIGCIFELTQEGVRRIEKRALAKLRNCAQVETLKCYLG